MIGERLDETAADAQVKRMKEKKEKETNKE